MKSRLFILLAIIPGMIIACNQKNSGKTEKSVSSDKVIQTPEYKKMIIAKVYLKPGKEADFIKTAQVIIENSNTEPGCENYALYQDPIEKTNFVFVERYKNQDAVDSHFSKPYFKDFGPKISDMTSKPLEIKIFDICGEK